MWKQNEKLNNNRLNYVKNGFTLVELLGVIILLGLTLSVGISVILRSINTSKDKSYDEQISRIIQLSKVWESSNTTKAPKDNEIYYLTMLELRESSILEDDIIDPRDNSLLDGCVEISKRNTLPTYEYLDICPSYLNDVYTIVYNLDGGTLQVPNPATYTTLTETFTLKNPTKKFHSFVGWKENSDDNVSPNVTIYRGSLGNRTYTAIYKIDDINPPTCTIELTQNDSTVGISFDWTCTDAEGMLATPSKGTVTDAITDQVIFATDMIGNSTTLTVKISFKEQYSYRQCKTCKNGASSLYSNCRARESNYKCRTDDCSGLGGPCGFTYQCESDSGGSRPCAYSVKVTEKNCKNGCKTWNAWSEYSDIQEKKAKVTAATRIEVKTRILYYYNGEEVKYTKIIDE